jgi:hypothetical protein
MTAPDGYQIGTVFVQVLPSLRRLNTRIAAKAAGITDIPIEVEPHLAVSKAKTAMRVLTAELERSPVVKDIELNERKLIAKLNELTSRRNEMVLGVDADVSKARARIDDLTRKRGNTKIDVDAEIAKAEAKIRTLASKRETIVAQFDVDTSSARASIVALRESVDDDVDIDVDVDSDDAESTLRRVNNDVTRLRNNRADINMEASDASRAIAIIGALTAAIGVLGHAAPAAAAAVAAIPSAVLAAAQGVGVALAGFAGISDATKALQAVDDEATVKSGANSKARISAANRVASAQEALQGALENADRTAIQNAHAVTAARAGVTDAMEDGARRVADAEQALTRAQVDALDAQEALTRARKDAAERLQDLHLATAGAVLDEQAAVIALQRARDRLTAGQASGVGGLDLAELQLSARQAEQSLAEIRERLGDLRDEQAESNRTGIEGSAGVVDAQRRARDAVDGVRTAEQTLARERVEATERVTAAQERVAEAQQRAGWAAADASRQVAAAQRGIAEATLAAGDTGSAAMDKLALTMAKLSPEGQRFVQFLSGTAKPAMQDLAAAASSTMLPKVQAAFGILLTQQGFVADAFRTTGDTIGDIALKGAMMVTSGPWVKDFGTIVGRNKRLLEHFGDVGLSALDSVRHLTIAGGPLAESLASSAEAAMGQAAAFLESKRESGELQLWFARMKTRLHELWETVSQIAGGFWDLAQALAPLGKIVLDILGPLVSMIGSFAEANPTLTTIIALAVLMGSSFVSLFRTLGGLSQAVRTSVGVFQSMKASVVGVKRPIDDVTTGTGRATQATGELGAATERTGGFLGRVRASMGEVATSYRTGATAAENWASRLTTTAVAGSTAVGAHADRAAVSITRSMDTFLPGTTRARTAFTGLASGVQTSFQRVSSVVGGAASATAKGVGTLVGGVTSALGGPFGLAIAGVTVGLGLLAAKQAEAAAKAAEHKAQIETLTDALVESNGAIDENVIKSSQKILTDRSLDDNARHLSLNFGQMTRALLDGGEAASQFESELFAVGNELARSGQMDPALEGRLTQITNMLADTGGEARDFELDIKNMAETFQRNTGATDEATDAYRNQLTEFLDLVGGYHGAKGEFKGAAQNQKDIADAQNDAATGTERHYSALKKLNDAALASINKDIAHRQSLNSYADAQSRVADVLADATSTTDDLTAARLGEEQAALQVIASAGELAFANSTATTEAGKLKDATIAQVTAAVDLANKFQGPLPASLQTYLDKMFVAKDATGQYKVALDDIPDDVITNAIFNDGGARDKVVKFGGWIKEYFDNLTLPTPKWEGRPEDMPPIPIPGSVISGGGALGAIAIPAYASGGLRSMSAGVAQFVPPNTPRLIGDRMRGDEAYIPIDGAVRSIAILAEAARRMGFLLLPLASGAIAMANGGINQGGQGGAAVDDAALVLQPDAIDAFSLALQDLTTEALVGLAHELNATTTPALVTLEEHAGVTSVAAINALMALLVPLRASFAVTSAAVRAAWTAMSTASYASVSSVGGYMSTLRAGLQATRSAMTATADWSAAQWARVRTAAGDPVRWVLRFPLNAGLIAAWNRLNTDFAMGKPVAPIAVPFREGGRVHGIGNEDKVKALLTPGEIVFDRLAIANLGGVAQVERLRQMARAGIIGPDERLGGEPGDAALRRRLMRTVPLDGLGFAYGGVQPHVALAGEEIEKKFGRLPGGIGGVGSRPNASDHPRGLALDFMSMQDTALGNRIAGYLIANAQRMAVKYLIWQQKFNEGSGWSPMEDRGSITANHFDHVHSSFLALGQRGRPFSGEGAALDPAAYFADTYKLIGRIPQLFPGNIAAGRAATVATQATDAAVRHADFATSMGGNAGDVESWRPLVLQALRMLGLPATWADITLKRMNQESGGNPVAVNNWDINAQRGDPSRGLMQVIGSTFAAHRDTRAPNNVLDPLANILASMKYAMSRYGSLPAAYGRPGGYDDGGLVPPGYSTLYNGLRRPEVVLTDNQWNAVMSLADMNTAPGGDFRGNLYLSSGEFLGAVEGVVDRANTDSGRVLARRIR